MDINRVHEIYLQMLKELDDFFKSNNIKYYLSGGTLLGAIREKGFIPWDDDCDINISREDYDKLKKISNQLKKYNMQLLDPHDKADYFQDYISKIFWTKEVYREDKKYFDNYDGLYKYLWIDLFIYDDIPKEKKQKIFFIQKIIYGLSMGHRKFYKIHENKSFILSFVGFILSIVGKLFPLDILKKWHYNISTKYNNKNYGYIYCSNYSPAWMNTIVEKKLVENIIYVDFENIKLPIIESYDKYLTHWYGDYMKRPEKNKQIPEHKENVF